jgi:endoglucanase
MASSGYRFAVYFDAAYAMPMNNCTFDLSLTSSGPIFTAANATGVLNASGNVYEYKIVSDAASPCPFGTKIPTPQHYDVLPYRGVNFSGFDFGPPPVIDQKACKAVYFIQQGCNTLRVPFSWEYFQTPTQVTGDGTPVDFTQEVPKAYLELVQAFASAGVTVIIDMHNYMRYGANVIGDSGSSVSMNAFATAWASIAMQFLGVKNVMFDLMNEPHDVSPELVLRNYNAAIAAIRKAEGGGYTHTILLEGTRWSGMHSWFETWDGQSSNADTFIPKNINDSAKNYMINVHQYLDPNFTGTTATCVPSDDVSRVTGVVNFASWLVSNNLRGIVTEVNARVVVPGTPASDNCKAGLETFLGLLKDHAQVSPGTGGFVGWTAWSAGAFSTDYIFDLNPSVGTVVSGGSRSIQASPEFAVFQRYLTPLTNTALSETADALLVPQTSSLTQTQGTSRRRNDNQKEQNRYCRECVKPYVIGISVVSVLAAFALISLLIVAFYPARRNAYK